MTEIESNSYQSSHRIVDFFKPSGGAIFIYIFSGILLVTAYNYNHLVKWISNNYVGATKPVRINVLNSGISHSFSTVWDGRLGQILLWGLIGAFAYIAIWFLKNLLNSFENDVIIDHYLHPANFSRAGFWGSAISGQVFFAAMCILWIIYTFMSLTVILPATADLAYSSAVHLGNLASVGYLLLCILIPSVLIYIWILISKIVRNLWQLFTL